ncbi:hypothetical protein [Halostagnicola sp. A-GB9-2]|uniref:hypothetical protein n=1 Tax=Halostagnicola sp. A-GB9-2 TaxID=3048066 RepID=UPI0024C080F6|nr:hypothetical protein [Halostagnicola sp. A-GB9-2]MDJ1431356.1 hypothetical protein [Halostagnicola sp. A-GB9-2]
MRRRLRHPQILVALSVGIVVGAIAVVGSLPLGAYEHVWPQPGAYHYGALAGENGPAVLGRAREIGAIGVVAITALTALSAVTSDAWEESPPELVTAISVPEAILGVLGDELLESSWFVAPVVGAGALAFAAGTGSPATLAGATVGATAIALSGLLLGASLGLGVRAVLRRSSRLYAARYTIGMLSLFFTFVVLSFSRQIGNRLAATPLGWYGDVLVATTPGVASSSLRVGGALTALAVVFAGCLPLTILAGRTLWFDEGQRAGSETKRDSEGSEVGDDGTESMGNGLLGRSIDRFAGRPTAGVTQAAWRRMRRAPRAMTYVLLPIGLLWPVVIQLSWVFPRAVPVLVVTYLAVAVGLGTTLNPIGNARVALPAILTTPDGRRSVLQGHALAALVPGVPLVVTVALVAGVTSGYSPIELLALILVAAALTTGGVGVSLGIGAWLPNLEGPATSATLTPPELYAMVAFLFVMSVLSAPAMVGLGVAEPVGSQAVAAVFVVVATGVCCVGAGWLGYRYARRSLEAYETT